MYPLFALEHTSRKETKGEKSNNSGPMVYNRSKLDKIQASNLKLQLNNSTPTDIEHFVTIKSDIHADVEMQLWNIMEQKKIWISPNAGKGVEKLEFVCLVSRM